ncbi:hypothetical protein MOO45_07395 [Bombilactobacillus folatiphilus]|uniref:Uncharacterized protein n=1 Tax=Bombilactobacillus folatiphilus TaxID=2923362 RepID=A0ABY4P912_9LACO|nr:hypothetical protein [Bombilactobacillus folatiphilus]UQS82006.1 hypothetical protein MOO45_07395 [Bombilactobacillus folatiphilus]
MIDDGFNSPEYTQEEQTVPRGIYVYSKLLASLPLGNNLTCDFITSAVNDFYYYKYSMLHDSQTSFALSEAYEVSPLNAGMNGLTSLWEVGGGCKFYGKSFQ